MELVKGFKEDNTDATKLFAIRNLIEDTYKKYGYAPAETPIIESEKFVKGDNPDDEAVSSTFGLKDRGGRKLALRYEFTFQLKRLARNMKLPYRRYQIGPVFRDEPSGPNRWKQFTQCDADVIGSTVNDEVDLLSAISEVLSTIEIPFTIYVNNRELLNDIIISSGVAERDREAVIREIDKLDKLSVKEVKKNLAEYGAEAIVDELTKDISEYNEFDAANEMQELLTLCEQRGIPVSFRPYLARGLSYYNGTILEVKTAEMKETIISGGAYMNNGNQSFGVSFGLDRLEVLSPLNEQETKVLVISLGQDQKARDIATELRKVNVAASVFTGKPGKALDYANVYKYTHAIFVGEEEIKKKKYGLKDLLLGTQTEVTEKQILKTLQ